MILGEKLKNLRKHYGLSQAEMAKNLNISQHNVSYYESTLELTGLLEYIYSFCEHFNIPVSEFFMENVEELKDKLPDYIKPKDAAILKILNTHVDQETRIQVKKVFVEVMRTILLKHKDKLGHLPEFQELFKDEE